MEKPSRLIINCETGEETVVELTDAEIAQVEADRIAWAEMQAAREAAEAARVAAKESAKAKLAALGLTPEEIAAL